MAIFKKKKLKTEDIGSEESMFPAMPEDKPEEPKKAAGPDVDKLVGEADALSLISGSFPAGSAGDIALARALRDNAASAAGAKARLEPFYARPLLGKNSLIILAVLYLFCLILYFGYAPLALAVLVLFMPVAVFLVLGRKTFSFLLPKKTAYNAVAYRDFGKKITKTIIISSNYDGEYGTPYSTGKLKRAAPVFIIYSFASIFVLFLFCILKIVFGFDTPAEKAALSVIPLLLCLLGVGFFATYTSWDKNNIEKNNLKAAGVALAVFKYFSETEALAEGTRLVWLSVSGKNCGNTGAEAFIKQHEDDGFLINPVVFDIGEAAADTFTLVKYDLASMTEADAELAEKAESVLKEKNIPYAVVGKGRGELIHHVFAPFSQAEIPAVTLSLRAYSDSVLTHAGTPAPATKESIRKLFEAASQIISALSAD